MFTIYSPSLTLLPRRKIQTKVLGLQEEVCTVGTEGSVILSIIFIQFQLLKKVSVPCKLHGLQKLWY